MDFIPKNIRAEVQRIKQPRKLSILVQGNSEPHLDNIASSDKFANKGSSVTKSPEMTPNYRHRENSNADSIISPPTQSNEPNKYLRGRLTKIKEPMLENVVKEIKVTPEIQSNQNSGGMLMAASRKEVAQMRTAMRELLSELKLDSKTSSSSMNEFVAIIKEENKIYDRVFKEMIRQVTVTMIERGELLGELRDRYAQLFAKIPGQVLEMHNELIAHRKLNRRLTEELQRSREHISELLVEMRLIHSHDKLVQEQAKVAQEKLSVLVNTAEHAEESMESFHNLYRLQRQRMENTITQLEKENRLWIKACTGLIVRLGKQEGTASLLDLEKIEEKRFRLSHHISVSISKTNIDESIALENKIAEWRENLTSISRRVIQEDYENMQVLNRIMSQIRKVIKNLITNEPQNDIELNHEILFQFHILDVASLNEHVIFWNKQMLEVTYRFTTGRDVAIREEIAGSRRQTQLWIEVALRLLRRNGAGNNGEEYRNAADVLDDLKEQIYDWTNKLEVRVAGEDGVVNFIVTIQGLLEDRLTVLSSKDQSSPLTETERDQAVDSLQQTVAQMGRLLNLLANTSERDQDKVPLLIENWFGKVLKQINADMDFRNEENIKIHSVLIEYLVHAVLPENDESDIPLETKCADLQSHVDQYKQKLLNDASGLELTTDDGLDMRSELDVKTIKWKKIIKKILKVDLSRPATAIEPEEVDD